MIVLSLQYVNLPMTYFRCNISAKFAATLNLPRVNCNITFRRYSSKPIDLKLTTHNHSNNTSNSNQQSTRNMATWEFTLPAFVAASGGSQHLAQLRQKYSECYPAHPIPEGSLSMVLRNSNIYQNGIIAIVDGYITLGSGTAPAPPAPSRKPAASRFNVPPPAPVPMRTPFSARGPPVGVPAPARASVPVPTPAPASSRTPFYARGPAPARVPAPARASVPVPTPVPAPTRTPFSTRAPSPARASFPARVPAPTRASVPVPTPAPTRTSFAARGPPAPVRNFPAPAAARASSFGNAAPAPAGTSSRWPRTSYASAGDIMGAMSDLSLGGGRTLTVR